MKNVQICSNTENDNNAYTDTCKYSPVLIFPNCRLSLLYDILDVKIAM